MFGDLIKQEKEKEVIDEYSFCIICYSSNITYKSTPMVGTYYFECERCGHVWM